MCASATSYPTLPLKKDTACQTEGETNEYTKYNDNQLTVRTTYKEDKQYPSYECSLTSYSKLIVISESDAISSFAAANGVVLL